MRTEADCGNAHQDRTACSQEDHIPWKPEAEESGIHRSSCSSSHQCCLKEGIRHEASISPMGFCQWPPHSGRFHLCDGQESHQFHRSECRTALQDTSCSLPNILYASLDSLRPMENPTSFPACRTCFW